jgi:hypothetical protein
MKIDKRPLKAFVRYDGSGRVVASSLILRRKKPKVGKWVEIPAYECCNDITTTTTTTTAAPPSYYSYTLGFGPGSAGACSDPSPIVYYAATPTLSIGTTVYTDSSLTTPVSDGYYCMPCPNTSGINFFSVQAFFGGAGKVFSTAAC